MAITTISKPQAYAPCYNGLPFVFDSDNKTEDGFQYLVLITVWNLNTTETFQSNHRVAPNPDTGYCIIDLMRMVESHITHDPLTDLDTNFIKHTDASILAIATAGESYIVDDVQTDFPSLKDESVWAINASLEEFEFIDFDHTDYLLGSVSKKFLTDAPDNKKVKLDSREWLYSICATPTNYGRRQVKTYDSSGSLLNTYNSTNSNSGSANPLTEQTNRFIRTTCGPAQLSDIGVSFTNVSYYTVQAQKTDGTAISEIRTYVIDDSCSKYDSVRVHFLSRMGGFDSFSFDLLSIQEDDIKRTNYKTARSISPSKSDRIKKISGVQYTTRKIINSNWLTESEHEWLKELVTSPVIFIEDNDELIAVNCTDVRYKQQKKDNEKLFNLTLSLEYTVTNFRQRF